ncbi:MAG TPA: ABC transporter permease, partial [Gemmatimonadaceae bacterium]|nr:ABC transporter permease [Gemmatimonadaceae bacterium]
MQSSSDDLPPRAHEASTWRRYLHFWRTRASADVDDEFRFHFEMLVARNRALGMSPDEARRAAAQRLGDLARHSDECVTIAGRRHRRLERALAIDALIQDLRYALRTLARQKAWTAAAVLTLAIGIGATTSVFSVLNGLILNQLPYRDADRIVIPWRQDQKAGYMMSPSEREVVAWRASHSIEDAQSFATSTVDLTSPGAAPTKLSVASIGSGFMRFAGVGTILGRGFDTTETQVGGPRSVVLGEGFWRTRFGASRAVLGRHIILDDTTYTIVGVASEKLRLPSTFQPTTDLWLPFILANQPRTAPSLARLAAGVTVDAAQRELESLAARDTQQSVDEKRLRILLQRPRDSVYIRGTIYLFTAAVAAIFLIACANVAHLLLARGAARQRELAIRAALGASWTRIARQLVTESLVIAFGGGALGVGLAFASLRWVVALRPDAMSQLDRAAIDRPVLLLAVAATAITGVVFGLIAAMQRSRRDTDAALKSTAMSGTATRGQSRARSLLVATEMALSAMLLVGAVLVVRSAIKVQQIDPGFNADKLYAARYYRPASGRGRVDQTKPVVDALVERAKQLPVVSSVTVASETPPRLSMMVMPLEVQTERGTYVDSGTMFVPTLLVRPNFFTALGVRLTEGATFSAGAEKRNELIINESLARRLWPGQHAIGRHIRFAAGDPKNAEPWNTVVGVANDIAVHELTTIGQQPLLYYPDDGSARSIL